MSRSTWCLLFLCGSSLSLVSLESWWILSSIPWADCSRVSLSLSLGVSIEFPCTFLSWVSKRAWLVQQSLPLTLMRHRLVTWLIPVSSRWALTSTRSIPAVITLFRLGASMWVSFSVGRGVFHSLGGGLALSWRWVHSRASLWIWVLKSRTAGVLALFSEAIFCLP